MVVARRSVLALVVVIVGLVSATVSASASSVYSNACSSLGWPALCVVGEFAEPIGVGIDNSTTVTKGDVYVVVYSPTPEVLQFTENGVRTGLAPVTGPAGRELKLPLFAAVDSSTGDFYVDDYSGGVVDKFKPNGELEEAFGTSGQVTGLVEPTGIAVQQSTGDVFVADRGSDTVKEYSSSGGSLGSFKVLPDPLNSVGVDSAGDVYIDQEGGPVDEYPAGQRSEPVMVVTGGTDALAVDQSTGKLFVSENNGGEIVEFEHGGVREGFAAGELGSAGSFGIGINETNHTVYSSNRAEGLVGVYALGPPSFVLTVSRTGTGSGEVTSTPVGVICGAHCQGKFEKGQTVKLKAIPAAGSILRRWGGCEAEPSGECEVTMSSAKTVTAVFQETPSEPLIEAQGTSTIGQTTATLTGTVNPKSETPSVCVFDYSVEAALLAPSVAECVPHASELGEGNTGVPVSASPEGLAPNKTYYYRLAASNKAGAGDGVPQHFLTLPDPPTVTTGPASGIGPYSATISGEVNPGSSGPNSDTTFYFQYSRDLSYSNQVPLTAGDAGQGITAVKETAQLEGLAPDTVYHYRIVASNDNQSVSGGLPQAVYGQDEELKTLATPPILGNTGVSDTTTTGATVGGSLNPEGLLTRYALRLGTDKGALLPVASGRTSANRTEPFTFTLSTLFPGTTYYYEVVAENADGTVRSPEGSFTTPPTPVVQTQLAQSFPQVVLLGVPANGFPPEEARMVVTKTTLSGRCPKGKRRSRGRCVRAKRKHKPKKTKRKR